MSHVNGIQMYKGIFGGTPHKRQRMPVFVINNIKLLIYKKKDIYIL